MKLSLWDMRLKCGSFEWVEISSESWETSVKKENLSNGIYASLS